MRTEIVIPFTFDTAPMESFIQEQGLEEVKRVLQKIAEDGVREVLPKKYIGYGPTAPSIDWKNYFEVHFTQWLNDHADEIIDEAALLLAAKAGRKKAWREVLADIKEDSNEG